MIDTSTPLVRRALAIAARLFPYQAPTGAMIELADALVIPEAEIAVYRIAPEGMPSLHRLQLGQLLQVVPGADEATQELGRQLAAATGRDLMRGGAVLNAQLRGLPLETVRERFNGFLASLAPPHIAPPPTVEMMALTLGLSEEALLTLLSGTDDDDSGETLRALFSKFAT